MQRKSYNVKELDKIHEVVCAFDIGAKNPARTVIEIKNGNIRVIDITKLDWSTNWEKQIAEDIFKFKCTTVLLERQPKKSPYIKFIYFIKGLLYSHSFIRVFCVSPVMTGKVYKNRKRKSVIVFLKWMNFFGLKDLVPKHKKLDDVADSFNIAMRFVLTELLNLNYCLYNKKCKI